MNYKISEIAEHDIEEIIAHIKQDAPQTTLTFINSLYDHFDLLAENPLMGHVREDLTLHPVRFWTFKWHYLIIYRVKDTLEIVRVLSGFRDIARIL